MNRAARRREAREVAKDERLLARMRQAPGVGLGWRPNNRGKRYPVVEPDQPINIHRLVAESDAAAERIAREHVAGQNSTARNVSSNEERNCT